MAPRTKQEEHSYKMMFQVIALVAAIFAQGIGIYTFLKSEVQTIAQVEANKIVQDEFEKRQLIVSQIDNRVNILELAKAKQEGSAENQKLNVETLNELDTRVQDLEDSIQNNFRTIQSLRSRVEELEARRTSGRVGNTNKKNE